MRRATKRLLHIALIFFLLPDFVAYPDVSAATTNDYYIVEQGNVTVYDNSSGQLEPVGYLNKGEKFKRIRDYGSWHEIYFNGSKGYVYKSATSSTTNQGVSNWISTNSTHSLKARAQDHLTVYDNSSGGLEPFARIYKGTSFNYISQSGSWITVEISGRKGYVYAPAVQKEFTSSDQYFEALQDNVTVYDNSTGSLEPVGYLNEDEKFKRIRDYGNWHEIYFNGSKGYVYKSATSPTTKQGVSNWISSNSAHSLKARAQDHLTVYDNSSGGLEPFARIYKGTSFNYISQSGLWIIVEISGRKGYVYAPAVQKEFTSSDQYFEVIQGDVTVYDNSTGSLKPIGYLNEGEKFKRIRDYGSWHEIYFNGSKGYVYKSATLPTTSQGVSNWVSSNSPHNLKARAQDHLTVYDNSSGGLEPFARIYKGTTFNYISQIGSWMIIEISGRKGYIYAPAVEIVSIKIFLDPGHGGHDPGGQGYGLSEKNVVLDIAENTKKQLENNFNNVLVKMSRTSDEFIKLTDRAKMANEWGAHYFVSIHNNAHNGSANGFESFIHPNASIESERYQKSLHNDLVEKLNYRDRGEKEANFSVLRNTEMPSTLLEYLFIDNESDNKLLRDKNHLQKIGEVTAESIAEIFQLEPK